MKKALDYYYKWPLIIDALVILATWLVSFQLKVVTFNYPDQTNLLSLISNLIGTMISLAGFILASLTIIVTFKSSLIAKGVDEATNALELLFSSRHYNSIVKVFKDSIIEFVIYTLVAYCLWQSYANYSIIVLNQIVVSLVMIVAINVFRSLFMLFKILSLEH